ncbi:hypothetical protein GCM10007036_01110 [Alsobacter metallidurans]|uniref:Cupin domain-containing protein n=1 Tax=Alsobacter metallidurans TaxID=340221 RepID=A0A917MFX0_9HYPH|nr:cupin domain-containing protein [Alsobacter metallidurans]GGH06648.1 hypothetical protein GCM10007036_01110 [Alsobacter metallidurans]
MSAGSPEAYRLQPNGGIPNSQLPLLVYREAFPPSGDVARAFERIFAANGWTRSWRNGVFDYHHFHSTAHEVLGVSRGDVKVQFGGEGGPVIALEAGDAVAIPAGVAHRNCGQSADFEIVGAYDRGRDWDVRRGDPGELDAIAAAIAAVPAPTRDPLHGDTGALPSLWAAVPEAPPGVA